jgi:hypothetical protein
MKINEILGVAVLGLLSWGGLQLYQMNAIVAVISYKVDENHKMIKPLWQEFLALDKVADRK